ATGKLPRIILYRRPICSIFAGDSSGTSPERPICFFYLCHTGADTRHRAEGTWTSTLEPGLAFNINGIWFGFQRNFRSASGPGETLFEYAHRTGEFACGGGLRTDGTCSPERALPGCRGAGGCWMDTFSF